MKSSKIAVVDKMPPKEDPYTQYAWYLPEIRESALQLHELMLKAKRQGLSTQELLLRDDLTNLQELDQSIKAISDGRLQGFEIKPFAVVLMAATNTQLTVTGENWNWTLVPARQVDSTIPHEAIKAMLWANSQGFDDFWVAFPIPMKVKLPGLAITNIFLTRLNKASTRLAGSVREMFSGIDPVLVVSSGKSGILLEICRWS